MRVWLVVTFRLLMTGAVAFSGMLPAGVDDRQRARRHFYNLEYDQAIAEYTKLIEENPTDPLMYGERASAQLYRELYRLGLLDTSALMRDNRFLRAQPPQADPGAKTQFMETLERGRHVAQSTLMHDPHNELALYALCKAYALQATYDFMLEKAWFAALRNGSRARRYCEDVRRQDPAFVDAYLVLGGYEYTIGSLPFPIRLLAGISGFSGSKSKGIEYVSRVAQKGKYDRDAARVLLAILYQREKRPADAAPVLEALLADYPRNYIFGLELASVYTDSHQPERASAVLNSVRQQADHYTSDNGGLSREAVQRKIEAFAAQLSIRRNDGSSQVAP